MASRDEILADFQACTGIEDFDMALSKLEDANWVLTDAVNTHLNGVSTDDIVVLPDSNTTTNQATSPSDSDDIEIVNSHIVNELPAGPSFSDSAVPVGNSSVSTNTNARIRMLSFYITHDSNNFHLKIPDSETVQTLKSLIQAETSYPPDQQTLIPIASADDHSRLFGDHISLQMHSAKFSNSHRRLVDLQLPLETFLHLSTNETASTMPSSSSQIPAEYRLKITDASSKQTLTLNFRDDQTINDLKTDVFHLLGLAVERQQWTGWPCSSDQVDGSATLSSIFGPYSSCVQHELTVDRIGRTAQHSVASEPSGSVRRSSRQAAESNVVTISDNDSDDDSSRFEEVANFDDDDDFFETGVNSTTGSGRLQSLIPDNFGDTPTAVAEFKCQFVARYGQLCPDFHDESLDAAIESCCSLPPATRKQLIIYVHHDFSVLSNVFCSQVLCSESLLGYIKDNFGIFGWDATFDSNRKRLTEMVLKHFGSVTSTALKRMPAHRFPVLAIVSKVRRDLSISELLHGDLSLDEIMCHLMDKRQTFATAMEQEINDEMDRNARTEFRQLQDLEFEQAQMADRQREAEQRALVHAAQEERQMAEVCRQSAIEAAVQQRASRARKRFSLSSKLTPEPHGAQTGSGSNLVRVRFRVAGGLPVLAGDDVDETDLVARLASHVESDLLPFVSICDPICSSSSGQWERKFDSETTTLDDVFNYLTSLGLDTPDDYKVISSWPRRDLTTVDASQTLASLNISRQETLTVERR